MKLVKGITYWGYLGKRQIERLVNVIETRSSGTKYVHWTHKKKDGTDGKSSCTEERKFKEWAKGIYELAVMDS